MPSLSLAQAVSLLLYGASLAVFLRFLFKGRTSRLPLPPGPKRLPFIGSALSFPSNFEWKTYAQWSKDLKSGIVYAELYGQSMIIINSLSIAKELLDRRAIIYSGRPNFIMLNEIMGCDVFFVHKQYSQEWKVRRMLFHQEIHPSQTDYYQPQSTRLVREYLHLFLDHPQDFMAHNRNLVGAIAILITYGIKVLKQDDPYIMNAEQAAIGITMAQYPGNFLVESLPFLKYVPAWFPGAHFQRLGAQWAKNSKDMLELPFAAVMQDKTEGSNELEPSFASRCLDNASGVDISNQELIIKEAVGNFYFGAVDTSVSALNTFILAMVLHPEVQKKAQEELDAVVPYGHLPDFSYESSLPYIAAVVREVLRWHPVTPLGVPHVVITDDIFEGYHIPAKSVVVANTWAMLHDEEMYPEPHLFRPERFLKDGQLDPDVRDPSVGGAFGFGRRGCPGAHIAKSTIWIFVTTFLTTMSIGKARDKDGVEITPSPNYSSATISHPTPFKCTIRARSKEAEALVRLGAEEDA